MTISVTSICNRGLQHLGAARILDITDDTRNGRSCNACYDAVRRSELRKYNWRFALKRDTLAPLTAAPAFDYTYQFQLPADYLRILKPADPYLDWQLENGKILTNLSDTLNLRYIADIEDPTLFDAMFAEGVSLKMADAMCEEITQSTGKKATISQDYKDLIKEARRVSAFETIPAEPVEDEWLLVRDTSCL